MHSIETKDNGHYLAEELFQVETILEQGSSPVNEDRLCVTTDVFGVFDGSTSLNEKYCIGRETGGQRAAQIASTIVTEKSGSLARRIKLANQVLCQAMKKDGVDTSSKENLWATSASVVQLHENNLEWCQVGDCRLVLVYSNGSHRLISAPVDHDKETLDLMSTLGGRSNSLQQSCMQDQVVRVRRRMNVTYGALCGEDESLAFVRSGLEPLMGVTDILLFSDGLLLPDNEGKSIALLVELYKKGGLKAVRNRVRSLQNEDDDCVAWPRFKKHDDISAIALRFATC